MIAVCAFSAIIVVMAGSDISVYVIGWIAFSIFWEIQRRRTMARFHGSLQTLLATQQVDRDKSPIGAVLDLVAEVSNQALIF